MASTDEAIVIDGVSKKYGSTTVVDDLTLSVPEGALVALVGPSGCGKTTTLRMINRLIEPSSGSITVLGQDQHALPPHELRRRIGYVIQHVGLFPHLTIRRNIAVVPELLEWDDDRIRIRTEELIHLVGLDDDVLDRYPSALSGGQQQRVGVARALAADPPILLMDEPFSAVDPIVRERLQDDLLALQREVRKTIVIVTHDIDEAIKLGDRVAIMRTGGHLVQYDRPLDILRSPADEFVSAFLGRERNLRQLSLLTAGDLIDSNGLIDSNDETASRNGGLNGDSTNGDSVTIDSGTPLTEVLDAILGSPDGGVVVRDGDELIRITYADVAGELIR